MPTRACPSEADLWSLALRNVLSPEAAEHLAVCSDCNRRVEQLRQERATIRSLAFSTALTSEDVDNPEPSAPHLSELLRLAVDYQSQTSATAGEKQVSAGSLTSPQRSIGKYLLVERLNSGGQGTVYRAWDPHLCRPVAVKLSHTRVEAGSASLSRIQREGTLLAQIDHPQLARVYDAGLDDGFPYLVMEYVPGVNLREYLEHHKLTDKEMRRIITEVSSAVAAAHRQGILHLDLKPDNVMIGLDGQCKLIDFGMGWLMMSGEEGERVRIVAGTFSYMAPEQLSGKSETWDRSTDVFGLGGLLCFLLTGMPPLPHRLVTTSSEDELEKTHQRLLHRVRHRRLSAICRRALSPLQQARFPDANAFHHALSNRRKRRVVACAGILSGGLMLSLGLQDMPRQDQTVQLRRLTFAAERDPSAAPEQHVGLEIQTIGELDPRLFFWTDEFGCKSLRGLIRAADRAGVWRLHSLEVGTLSTQPGSLIVIAAFPMDVRGRSLMREMDQACRDLLAAGGLPESIQRMTLENHGPDAMSPVPPSQNGQIQQFFNRLTDIGHPFTVHLMSELPQTEDAQQIALTLQLRTDLALRSD